jgi:aspartyl aminopeptidase
VTEQKPESAGKSSGELLAEQLSFKLKSAWQSVSPEEREAVTRFARDYMDFLDEAKTAPLCIEKCVEILRQNNFASLDELPQSNGQIAPGTKWYQNHKNKSLVCAVQGRRPLEEGVSIIGAHADSPCINLKANPLYEDSGLAFFDTQYYGAIKYYQWTAVPLALYGLAFAKDGTKKRVHAGGNAGDPVFCVTDLLPHLARDQMKKTASDFIDGEGLDILAGSEPFRDDKVADAVKLAALTILHEQYGITAKSFANAELSFVPAFSARDVGLDRSMIGAYGHDDKSGVYTALRALIDSGTAPEKTVMCFFTDKEEAWAYDPEIQRFKNTLEAAGGGNVSKILGKSYMLSADVNAAYDPNYADVYDKNNDSFLGCGIALIKSGTGNYADMDFCQAIQNLLEANNIQWQYGGCGKVGKGGGATIASDFAGLGIEVLDCGIPVLSMHSPFEVISKIDLWTAYRGFKAFLTQYKGNIHD